MLVMLHVFGNPPPFRVLSEPAAALLWGIASEEEDTNQDTEFMLQRQHTIVA